MRMCDNRKLWQRKLLRSPKLRRSQVPLWKLKMFRLSGYLKLSTELRGTNERFAREKFGSRVLICSHALGEQCVAVCYRWKSRRTFIEKFCDLSMPAKTDDMPSGYIWCRLSWWEKWIYSEWIYSWEVKTRQLTNQDSSPSTALWLYCFTISSKKHTISDVFLLLKHLATSVSYQAAFRAHTSS